MWAIEVLCHMGAVLLAALLVRGVLDCLPWRGWRSYVWRSVCWCGVVGGGTYGLALFDSRLLPVWSWGSLLVVIGGALVLVVVLEAYRHRHPIEKEDI